MQEVPDSRESTVQKHLMNSYYTTPDKQPCSTFICLAIIQNSRVHL